MTATDNNVKQITRAIGNVDRRLRIVENREMPTGGGGPTPGTGDAAYVHIQSSPSDTWTVVHNLNKYPAIDVVDTGGSMVIPDVRYDTANEVTIMFGSATSGRAFCN